MPHYSPNQLYDPFGFDPLGQPSLNGFGWVVKKVTQPVTRVGWVGPMQTPKLALFLQVNLANGEFLSD